MQVHLDPLGGAAGDMFVAALLSAFPDYEAAVMASIRKAAPQVDCHLSGYSDGVLAGSRFDVVLRAPAEAAAHDPFEHRHHSHHHGPPGRNDHGRAAGHSHDPLSQDVSHHHRPWAQIRRHLTECGLDSRTQDHAIGIFAGLAQAEGRVHGVDAEEVEFHEVGAWDSIADIVGAAQLITLIDANLWTVGALPLGGGRIRTAHGLMPVPAPATALLLEGFDIVDDGVSGERVTPTGAAILRYLLNRSVNPPDERPRPEARRLVGGGTGFGARVLPGISNCLRVLVFDAPDGRAQGADHRQLAVVEFEVDDQSSEDLAMGLDRLRAHDDIFDVIQTPVFGKKGRMMASVRLLARPGALDAVIAAAFRETTTIGLRHTLVNGAALTRTARQVSVEGRDLRVKVVDRPGGATAKTESDDVLSQAGHAQRARLRFAAEQQALHPTLETSV
jgi:uncharacterized protein (TIGR00299 family) protein